MTVEELVRAAARGGEDAFGELVRLYENKVYALALRMCGRPEDAWDVAQEAFLSAWRGLPSFRGESEFATWLYRLTSNAAIDHLRRARRQRGEVSLEALSAPDSGPSPQESAERGELRWAVTAGGSGHGEIPHLPGQTGAAENPAGERELIGLPAV